MTLDLSSRLDDYARRLEVLEHELAELRGLARSAAPAPSVPPPPVVPPAPVIAGPAQPAADADARRPPLRAEPSAPASGNRLVGVLRREGARVGRRRSDAAGDRLLLRARREPGLDRARRAGHARRGRLRPRLRRRPVRQAALRGAVPLGARRRGDRDRRRLHDPARSQGPLRPRSRLGGHAPRGRHRRSGSRNGACLVVRAHCGPWSRRRGAGSRRPRSRHRGVDGCGHRLCSSRVRGNGDRRDPAAVAAAARRRRRRHAAAGRRPARPGGADGVGRRRCGRVLLAALPRSGDRLAGPAWARLRSPRCPHRCSC